MSLLYLSQICWKIDTEIPCTGEQVDETIGRVTPISMILLWHTRAEVMDQVQIGFDLVVGTEFSGKTPLSPTIIFKGLCFIWKDNFFSISLL